MLVKQCIFYSAIHGIYVIYFANTLFIIDNNIIP